MLVQRSGLGGIKVTFPKEAASDPSFFIAPTRQGRSQRQDEGEKEAEEDETSQERTRDLRRDGKIKLKKEFGHKSYVHVVL